jgi:hypothetical protein
VVASLRRTFSNPVGSEPDKSNGDLAERAEGSHENDSANHFDSATARCSNDLALQPARGYYPSGGLGLVLLIVVILALTSRP